ncbi:MAG: hypothetical protein HXX20_00960 [Chloroflexi bacterium]|nr:hypothetical protein [Chloroflexota bacterium]
MLIQNLSWWPFRLPFAGAFGTARSSLNQREGWIIQIQTDTGLTGLGEASPLPEFGGGTPADVLRLLEKWHPLLIGQPIDCGMRLRPLMWEADQSADAPGLAAFLCGLDIALTDVLSQTEGKSLAEWLAGRPVAESVLVNATIGTPDNSKAAILAQKAVADGFECVKLKVGMAAGVSGELERVQAVRAAIGKTTRLRLDANGAWKPEEAITILRELEPLGIELVEQPVAAHDLAGMAQVRRVLKHIPIAADEAITNVASAQAVIAAGAADILVIKPMMVGGLRAGLELIKIAQRAGLGAFVTTTIDSGIGIAAALHLAATLPEPLLACGLATASLLQDTLVQELPIIKNGRMFLPDSAGLGMVLK